jgi:ABC-type lipoprotein export system ATPase subunit
MMMTASTTTENLAATPAGLAEPSDGQPAPIIQLRNLVKTYKNAAGEFTVLKGLDLTIYAGEFVSIVGKSGSGKSTLLNMITGIDHPTSGLVVVNGTDLYTSMNESERSLWRGKNLGIVFQFFQLLPMLTLLENVMLPMDYVGMYDFDERPKRAMELLERVGLAEFADKLPMSVSTGQQQSAAIARAMATDPPLIVADEPTGNLDTRAAENVMDLFENLVANGKTIVMVTHDPSLTLRTHRNVIISDGELIDEVVARALPLLTHPQMLGITKQVTRKMYQPGQPILLRNEEVRSFFMIAAGEVNVILKREKGKERVIARLKSGDFFGETSLLSGGRAVASVHAAGDTPAVLLELPREEFLKMIRESPLTEKAIGKIVQKRLAETGAVVPDKADKTAKKKKGVGSR